MSNDITIPGDEAYLTFGGWAKPMSNPPSLHERRRYVVDVECTDAALKTSSKGERGTRSLSILRVTEVVGAAVPAPSADGEDDDTPPMFNDDGTIAADAAGDDSADEGDEIMAQRREAAEQAAEDAVRAAAEQASADVGTDQEAGDPWPGDEAADAEVDGDDDADPAAPDNVSPMFKAVGDE